MLWAASQEGPNARQSCVGPGPGGMALGSPCFMQIPGVMFLYVALGVVNLLL